MSSNTPKSFTTLYLVHDQLFKKLLSIANAEEKELLKKLNPNIENTSEKQNPLKNIEHLLKK